MTEPRDSIDLANLPRFLKHLGQRGRSPMAGAFAQHLLDEGGEVVVFWGPEQMDVWQLTIRRGGYLVTFGVERGRPDAVKLASAAGGNHWPGSVPMQFAVFGWARAHAVDLVLDDPLKFRTDLLAHGTAALDWLGAGHEDVLQKIYAAFREGLVQLGPLLRPDQATELAAIQIRLMEEAASSRRA